MVKKKSSSKLKKRTLKKTAVKRKAKKVTAIPKGYHSITAYLIVSNGAQAIEFYKKVFGAKEMIRMERPSGKIGHAELKIGNARIMLADECTQMNAYSPHTVGGCPVGIHLYIKDVDNIIKRAVASGARLTREVQDMFYGDRNGSIEDPFGHKWTVSTHIEDVTPAQLKKRMAEMHRKK
jgi:PhnB protein